jgi:His-Xaa-Ser system radical SAM maturase HxsC
VLALSSRNAQFINMEQVASRRVIRLSQQSNLPQPLRRKHLFVVKNGEIPEGFYGYIFFGNAHALLETLPTDIAAIVLKDEYSYLADGDIIRIHPEKRELRVLYRRQSKHNSFLVTERCNHYCLMCSQPPKDVDDSWLVQEILDTIALISPDTEEILFSGGEPTLLGDRFLEILQTCKNYLPRTALHILSNGRTFADSSYTARYAAINHPDMMVGIPLYSDVSHIHDYVVQADNAFDGTIRGILNLKRYQQRVEIRVVIHKQTFERLPQLAEFIARNLIFVDQVVLMGLEITGFTKANMPDLWIDPHDYQEHLYKAVTLLSAYGINVSIYNHQLCTLDRRIWQFARKSISDWKNEYVPECDNCSQKQSCGGFFTSQLLKPSNYIRAIA